MAEIEQTGLVIRWLGGSCPVQGEGTVDGREWYFRARGQEWSFEVYSSAEESEGNAPPLWWTWEDWGTWPDAGYMPDDEARRKIDVSVERFRRDRPKPVTAEDHHWENHVIRAWSDTIIGSKAAMRCLGIDDEAILEQMAVERDLPLNGYYHMQKLAKEAQQANTAGFDPMAIKTIAPDSAHKQNPDDADIQPPEEKS